MPLNRTLQFAFLFSIMAHLVIITQNPGYLFFTPQGKNRKMEVNYLKAPKANNSSPTKRNSLLRNGIQKRNPPPFINRDAVMKADMQAIRKDLPFDRPTLIKPDIIAIRMKAELPQVDMKRINNPSYIRYYQDVYEKIRRSAYQNYRGSQTGEVCVTFTISSAGYLTDVRLVEERSKASSFLKNISLASVKNASPFPNFPKELDYYSQLSFNIIIFFGIE